MMNQYPKNIIQAIVLLLLGIIAVAPVLLIIEVLDLNIPAAILNQVLFVLVVVAIVAIYAKKQSYTFFFNGFWSKTTKLSTNTGYLLLLFLLIFQLGINLPFSKYLAFHIRDTANIANPLSNLSMLLGGLLLAPFCEEIIFRGIILRGFLGTYSSGRAIFYSTLIFSIIHVYPTLLFGALILGMFLGYVFYLSKSMAYVIFFHALANFITSFGGYYLYSSYGEARVEAVYGSLSIWIVLISTIFCTGLTVSLLKRGSLKKDFH